MRMLPSALHNSGPSARTACLWVFGTLLVINLEGSADSAFWHLLTTPQVC